MLIFAVLAQLHEVGAEDVLLALTLGALAAALGPVRIRWSASEPRVRCTRSVARTWPSGFWLPLTG